MRGEIVPPSELIVTQISPPRGGCLLLGGFLIRGGGLYYIIVYKLVIHNSFNYTLACT